jgi:hypothetical protein
MVELQEVLSGYFDYTKNLNKDYEIGLTQFYSKSNSAVRFESEKYQLKGAISHIVEGANSEAVLHIPDNAMVRTSEEKCASPLHFIPDCNYMYYGCYMSIACYILKFTPKYITLYHPVGDHDKFVLKYRPEVAKLFCNTRYESLQALAKLKSREVDHNKVSPILELYS